MTAARADEVPPLVQQVLDALPDARRSGEGWEARCPAHPDDSPSLVVSVGEDGYRPVLWCHGGCDYADVRAALLALAVPETALRPSGPGQRPSTAPQRPASRPIGALAAPPPPTDAQVWGWVLAAQIDGRLTRLAKERRGLDCDLLVQAEVGWDRTTNCYTLPIRDAVTAEVVDLRTGRRGGKDRIAWQHRKGGTARLFSPTGLGDGPVLLCEGEWDALVAHQHGFNAVGTTGGAGTVPSVDLLHPLRGRTVFIAFDCDEAGRTGAEKWAARLIGLDCRVHVVDLALPEKGADVSDWFARYERSAGELRELLESSPQWGGEAEEQTVSTDRKRFAVVSARELAEPVPPMRWLVKGIWPEKSYGVLAGEKKTLKTYNLLHMAAAVASGTRMFGQFDVPTAQPVLYLLGEGGSGPTRARLQRITKAMNVELADVPLFMMYEAASTDSQQWRDAVAAALDLLQPGVVMLDPLYAFHPPGIEAQNLYSRGQMLAELQVLLAKDSALVVADHFRKTNSGGGLDLDSIAQSGMAQWADSWVLQKHRASPEVADGNFFLRVEFGSRQWGGRAWDIDWRVGSFDEDLGQHDGDVSWDIRPAGSDGRPAAVPDAGGDLLTVLRDHPEGLTRTDLRNSMKGRKEARDEAIEAAIERGWLQPTRVEATDSQGRKTSRTLLVLDVDALTGTTRG